MLELVFGALFLLVLAWVLGRRSRLRFRVRLELLAVLAALFVAAAYVITKRFEGGLGAVSHMSDQFPWGIWIAFDLCGVALAAGGFLLAGTVYVLHLRRYEAILRPTILTAFIAYLLVAAILVLDLGRPYRFWHPLVMWQPHSVMFEITLCLTLYTGILMVEFGQVLCERFRWPRLSAALRRLTGPAVIVGVILSTLHQSSFGALFLIILPEKLHPFWYTPALPILFFLSAVSAGLAVVVIESFLCARFLGQSLAEDLVWGLGRAARAVLWGYLALKVGDLLWRGAVTRPAPPWLAASLGIEVVAGVLVPALWLGRLPAGRAGRGLFGAALLVIGGVVLNRLNVCWFGLLPFTGCVYWPSWMEVVLTVALAFLGVLAFVAIARVFPVFPLYDERHRVEPLPPVSSR